MFSMDLLLGAVVLGVLLGCFYAAVSVGLSVSFGLLDVPHVAHPAFLVLASYCVFLLNDRYDIDPLLAGLLIMPVFFVFGLVAYRIYYEIFEKRGSDAAVRGIAFFFGIAFIIEVLIFFSSASTSNRWRQPISASLALRRVPHPDPATGRFRGRARADGPARAVSVENLHRPRDQGGGAGRGGAAADGRESGAHQAMGLRYRDRGARDGRRAVDHRRPGRADPRPRLYRAHVLRRRAGRARQHERHAGRGPDPRRRRVHRAHGVRHLLGAGGLVRACCWSCSPSARKVCLADDDAQQHCLLGRRGGLPRRGAGDAQVVRNEYPFFAGYVVLQFIVLATAWNILGGYAGYVNFGTNAFFGVGAYTAVALYKVSARRWWCRSRRRRLSDAARPRGRSADPAAARHLLLDRDDRAGDHHRDRGHELALRRRRGRASSCSGRLSWRRSTAM